MGEREGKGLGERGRDKEGKEREGKKGLRENRGKREWEGREDKRKEKKECEVIVAVSVKQWGGRNEGTRRKEIKKERKWKGKEKRNFFSKSYTQVFLQH